MLKTTTTKTQQQLSIRENKNTIEFDKFIGTLVKTFISVISLSHLDHKLIFRLSQENNMQERDFILTVKQTKMKSLPTLKQVKFMYLDIIKSSR